MALGTCTWAVLNTNIRYLYSVKKVLATTDDLQKMTNTIYSHTTYCLYLHMHNSSEFVSNNIFEKTCHYFISSFCHQSINSNQVAMKWSLAGKKAAIQIKLNQFFPPSVRDICSLSWQNKNFHILVNMIFLHLLSINSVYNTMSSCSDAGKLSLHWDW